LPPPSQPPQRHPGRLAMHKGTLKRVRIDSCHRRDRIWTGKIQRLFRVRDAASGPQGICFTLCYCQIASYSTLYSFLRPPGSLTILGCRGGRQPPGSIFEYPGPANSRLQPPFRVTNRTSGTSESRQSLCRPEGLTAGRRGSRGASAGGEGTARHHHCRPPANTPKACWRSLL
jgi:hypothetical protein